MTSVLALARGLRTESTCMRSGMRCDPIDRTAVRSCARRGMSACDCGSRRSFLRSIAAAGAAVIARAPAAEAQVATAPLAAAHRIDVHHHFFPQFLLEAQQKAGVR